MIKEILSAFPKSQSGKKKTHLERQLEPSQWFYDKELGEGKIVKILIKILIIYTVYPFAINKMRKLRISLPAWHIPFSMTNSLARALYMNTDQ